MDAAAGSHSPHDGGSAKQDPACGRRGKALAALALVLLLAGIGLRFHRLGAKALWLDEVFTLVRAGEGSAGEILRRVQQNERHPPLFHLLSAPALRLLRGDAAARILPAVASSLTLALAALLAWRLYGPAAGLFTLALSACSSFQVALAQEGRPIELATFFLLASTFAFVRLTSAPRAGPAWLVLYAAAVALSLYTYYYALYPVLAQFLALPLRGGAGGRRWPVAAAGAAGILLLVPWIAYAWPSLVLFSSLAAGESGVNYDAGILAGLARALLAFPLGLPGGWPNGLLAAGLAVALGAALVFLRRRRGDLALFALLLGLPLLAVYVSPFRPEYFQPRHLAFVAPLVLVLLGGLLAGMRPRWAAALPLAAWLALNAWALSLYFDDGYRKTPVREMAEAVASAARPGDAVLLNPAFAVFSWERYADTQRTPAIAVYPDHFAELPARIASCRRIWLLEYRSRTFGPLASYHKTVERAMRFTGLRRSLSGASETLVCSLYEAKVAPAGSPPPAPRQTRGLPPRAGN